MNKKQQTLFTSIAIIVVVAIIAYFLFRNVRDVVTDKVAKRVSKDIAKEGVRRAVGFMGQQ